MDISQYKNVKVLNHPLLTHKITKLRNVKTKTNDFRQLVKNPQSGDFSLQASGFEIKNGKKGKPFDLITASGNLLEVFKDVQEVGNDVKVSPSGISAPSLLIKKVAVAGQ